MLAFLGAQRARKGAKWCRAHGVGAVRDALRLSAEQLLSVSILTKDAAPNALQVRTIETESLLALQCRMCGKCPLGQRLE